MKRWIFPALGVIAACGGKLTIASDQGPGELPSPVAPDGGRTAGGTGGAAVAFCASQAPTPRFCDDFDGNDGPSGHDPTRQWDIATRLNGDLKADVATATSPPAAFDAATALLRDGETANVHLRKTVPGRPAERLRLSASTRVTGPALTRGSVAILTLDLSPKHLFTLYLRDDGGQASLQEIGPAGTRRHLLVAPPSDRWTRLTIELVIRGPSRVSVRYGDDQVLDEDTFALEAINPTLRVGAVYVIGGAAPFEVRFDDVVLDF